MPFVKYAIGNSPFHQQFYKYMTRVAIPDETFFQTLIQNSPFCHTVVSMDHNFVEWCVALPVISSLSLTLQLFVHSAALCPSLHSHSCCASFPSCVSPPLNIDGARDDHADPKHESHKCMWAKPGACGRSPKALVEEDLPVVMATKFIFARKVNSNSEAFAKALEFTRPRPRQAQNEVQRVVLRSQNGCISSSGTGSGSVKTVPCDTADRTQLFTVGPCWGDDMRPLALDTKGCAADGNLPNKAREPWVNGIRGELGHRNKLCLIRSSTKHCLDFEGKMISENKPLVGWTCRPEWNQLFVMRPGTCSLAVEPPFLHKSSSRTRLCVTSSKRVKGQLVSATCRNNDDNQRYWMSTVDKEGNVLSGADSEVHPVDSDL